MNVQFSRITAATARSALNPPFNFAALKPTGRKSSRTRHAQTTNAAGRALYDKVADHAGFIVYTHEL